MKHIFIYRGWLTSKTYDIGHKIILVNSTNDHFIVRRLPFGVLWEVLGCGVLTFFEEEGATVTVTSDRYCEMLERFLRSKVAQLLTDYEPDDVWFQQDGATSHTSRHSLEILQDMFPIQVISLRGDIGWPPRSPDLNPCDFFLWGYVKSKVYEHRPSTLEHLKAAVAEEINAIPHNMLERVMVNFRERLQNCIDIGGRHLSDTIFKTT